MIYGIVFGHFRLLALCCDEDSFWYNNLVVLNFVVFAMYRGPYGWWFRVLGVGYGSNGFHISPTSSVASWLKRR